MKKVIFLKKNSLLIVFLIFSLLYVYVGIVYVSAENSRISETLSRFGSTGSEVSQIQSRLKNWGYYQGAIDGVYGSQTVAAVKYFQRANGLTIDGIAGDATLAAMGITSNSNAAGTNSSNVNLLARLINGEARGEPYTGMVAVGAVVLNRVASSKFPSTVAGVIYQSGAFDAVSDGQINLTPSQQAYNAARDALNGWDPSGGAIYYFNPATATNKWIWSRPMTITIGKHRFCK
ncbi:MAG: spore cortex-lytic enzyme [Clostridia bacterium]|nr:spore cortex-lytic enzyme [Clostridia bacterium]